MYLFLRRDSNSESAKPPGPDRHLTLFHGSDPSEREHVRGNAVSRGGRREMTSEGNLPRREKGEKRMEILLPK